MKERRAKCIILAGTLGTGKTSLQRDVLARAIKKNERGLVLLQNIDNKSWSDIPILPVYKNNTEFILKPKDLLFSGIRKIEVPFEKKDRKKLFYYLYRYYSQGQIMFDDCRTYVPKNLENQEGLIGIMNQRRQYKRDVIFAVHGMTDLPPQIITFVSEIVLFDTTDNIYRFSKYLQGDIFNKIQEAQLRIKEKAKTDKYYREVIKIVTD